MCVFPNTSTLLIYVGAEVLEIMVQPTKWPTTGTWERMKWMPPLRLCTCSKSPTMSLIPSELESTDGASVDILHCRLLLGNFRGRKYSFAPSIKHKQHELCIALDF